MEKFILRFSNTISILALCGALLSLSGCGSSSSEATGLDTYTQIGGTLTTATANEISGIGKIRFVTPLSGILTNNSFTYKAQLDGSTTASSTIVFNSNDLNVGENSGIAIKFTRNGINVGAQVGVNGNWVTVASSITNMYAPLALNFIIDIHNNTGSSNKTRVVIWRYTPYTAATADIDTNSSADLSGSYPSTQQAPGIYTGITVNQATVTGASVGTAKLLN